MWRCICDCGKEKEKPTSSYDLTSGKVQSCGCKQLAAVKMIGITNRTHGLTGTRLWNIWASMKRRCIADKNYANVGVCDDWKKFEPFYDWAISNGYSDELTIDRINPSGNYEPSNCRWGTWEVQENNKRNNRIVEYKGEKYTLSQLSKKIGISSATLRERLNRGWKEDELDMPTNLNNKNIRSGKYA